MNANTAASTTPPLVTPAPRFDAKFIEEHRLMDRYLEHKLPPKGAREFENWCRANPDYVAGLKLAERAQASLQLLEACGRTIDRTEQKPPWWKSPYALLGSGALAMACLLSLAYLYLVPPAGAAQPGAPDAAPPSPSPASPRTAPRAPALAPKSAAPSRPQISPELAEAQRIKRIDHIMRHHAGAVRRVLPLALPQRRNQIDIPRLCLACGVTTEPCCDGGFCAGGRMCVDSPNGRVCN